MGLYTNYTDAPQVDEEYTPQRANRIFRSDGEGGWNKWTQTIAESKYRIVGLTQAAAEAGADALSDPPDVQATAAKSGAGPAWHIEVVELTVGEWTETTP